MLLLLHPSNLLPDRIAEGRAAAILLPAAANFGRFKMESMMQTQNYNPVRGRNIPAEMAKIAQEKGEGLTRKDLQGAGYTDAQIDRYAHDASVIYAQAASRHAA
jgi:hypothetical protein